MKFTKDEWVSILIAVDTKILECRKQGEIAKGLKMKDNALYFLKEEARFRRAMRKIRLQHVCDMVDSSEESPEVPDHDGFCGMCDQPLEDHKHGECPRKYPDPPCFGRG